MKCKKMFFVFLFLLLSCDQRVKKPDRAQQVTKERGVDNFDLNTADLSNLSIYSFSQLEAIYYQQIELNESYKMSFGVLKSIMPNLCKKINEISSTCLTSAKIRGESLALQCEQTPQTSASEAEIRESEKIIQKSFYVTLNGAPKGKSYFLQASAKGGDIYKSDVFSEGADKTKIKFGSLSTNKSPPSIGELSEIKLVAEDNSVDLTSFVSNPGRKLLFYVSSPEKINAAAPLLGSDNTFIFSSDVKHEAGFSVIKLIIHASKHYCQVSEVEISGWVTKLRERREVRYNEDVARKKKGSIGVEKSVVMRLIREEMANLKINEDLFSKLETRVANLKSKLRGNSGLACRLRSPVESIKVILTGKTKECNFAVAKRETWNGARYSEAAGQLSDFTIFLNSGKSVKQSFSVGALEKGFAEFDFTNLASDLTVAEINLLQLRKGGVSVGTGGHYYRKYPVGDSAGSGLLGALKDSIVGGTVVYYDIFLCEVLGFTKASVEVNGITVFEDNNFLIENLPRIELVGNPSDNIYGIVSNDSSRFKFSSNKKYLDYLRDRSCEQTN